MWEVLATAFFSPIFFLLVRDEAEEDTKRTCKRLTRYYAVWGGRIIKHAGSFFLCPNSVSMGHAILGTTNGIFLFLFTNPTHTF